MVLLVVFDATFSFHVYAMSAAKWAKVPHLFDIFFLNAPIFVMHIKFQLHHTKNFIKPIFKWNQVALIWIAYI